MLYGLLVALAPAPVTPADAPSEGVPAADDDGPSPVVLQQGPRLAAPPDERRWMVGLEGVVLQTPPAQPPVITLDRRTVGRSAASGGVGLFGRYRPIRFIALDLGARTTRISYQGKKANDTVREDHVMADAAVLLYLGRGEIAQFAVSGGVGGQYLRFQYDLESGPDGTQAYGSALFRAGAEAEFLFSRFAFLLAVRSYGVWTDVDRVRATGDLGVAAAEPPIAALQLYLYGSAALAVRF